MTVRWPREQIRALSSHPVNAVVRTTAHRQIRAFRCYWPRSGGQVAWLCVLHVPRCDLGLGRTSGLPPVASFRYR